MKTPDAWAGLSAADRARAIAYQENQRAILAKREAAMRALLAPPGPAEAVKTAWEPVRQALDDRKAQAVTGAQDNAGKAGGGRSGTH